MFQSVSQNLPAIYDHFQSLTVKCTAANVLMAGVMREVHLLPACITGVTFSLSSSVMRYVANEMLLEHVPKEFKKDPRNYYKDHTYLHVVYFVYFFSLSVLGSALLTKGSLLFLDRQSSIKGAIQLAALDFIPFYYHEFFGSSLPKLS